MKTLSVAILLLVLGSGCGYTLQTSKSPLTEKEGIRKIFVAPFVNNTYSPGVENMVYNALVKIISVHRRVELVNRREDADAVLSGNITEADFSQVALTPASSLPPSNALGTSDIRANVLIATEYSAVLNCNFVLTRQHPAPGKNAIVWTSGLSRSEPFPGNNQLGVQGDTSELINESEFQRALGDLAVAMMGDLHESMLATF